MCGPKDGPSDIAGFLSPTCLLRALADFCCVYMPSRICIIQRDFSMAMMLSCVAIVAPLGRSSSAKIASTGIMLTCLVIALSAYI